MTMQTLEVEKPVLVAGPLSRFLLIVGLSVCTTTLYLIGPTVRQLLGMA